jgi:thymidylate synthase ThyX
MKDSLDEISSQRAEEFLNTFYFQYGHRSIADLAHLSFSIEKLSMLAAIIVVDEQRWDGQERSSRYQDFRKSGFYTPEFSDASKISSYNALMEELFSAYETISAQTLEYLQANTPIPTEMTAENYKRTLKARAFDVARYLLPISTMTSVGQIVNARTLAQQISRLSSSKYKEVGRIASALRESARHPPYDHRSSKVVALLDQYKNEISDIAKGDLRRAVTPSPAAPTLVKYTAPKAFDSKSQIVAKKHYIEIFSNIPIDSVSDVELVRPTSLENELVATSLYEVGIHPYRQILNVVDELSADRRLKLVADLSRDREAHDELRRTYAGGYAFQFDILMDIGGFRDMHRHRRCIQILQDYTPQHGFSVPQQIVAMGHEPAFRAIFSKASAFWTELQSGNDDDRAGADYALPLACKRRSLFKMDFAEAAYICELRTGPAGHFSYRDIAYKMFREIERREPNLAKLIRVTKPSSSDDILKR